MSKQTVIRIETYDTKKTYEFVSGVQNENPPLWEVGIFVRPVGSGGTAVASGNQYPKKVIHLERETLESCGLVPSQKKDEPKVEPTRTIEDVILELLEYVGVYPTE